MVSENEKEWYKVARLERAIREKYGEKAVINPRKLWSEEMQDKYNEEIKLVREKRSNFYQDKDKIQKNGYLVSKKLIKREEDRQCPVCETYSFKTKDAFYFKKYSCCFMCYIKYVEDREDRWFNGWRPNLGKNNGNDSRNC